MSVSIPEFWKLVIESRLLTAEQCQSLGTEFGRVKGAASSQTNARTLSQWLISRNALTQYQATILEAGRSGPFHYGDYKVYDRYEAGPFAGCFRAIHEPTSHPAVLKFVTGPAAEDANAWSDFVKQNQYDCTIVHPNLIRFYEPVDLGQFKFVAIEDVPGESLEQRVASGGPLRYVDVCRVGRLAALALASLHQYGRVHGDLRPSNLWLEANGEIRLLRDPLYTPQPLHVAQTDAASQLLERSDYMAPELAQQGKEPDVLSDIYALGCSLYFLLSGRPPFPGGDVMQKLSRHASEPIQPLEPMGVPPQVMQLITYMMAKNPAVRYQDASTVAEQIAPFVDPALLNAQPAVPPQTLPAYESWIKRKQSTLAAQASAAAAAPETAFPKVSGDASPETVASTGIETSAKDKEAGVQPAVKTEDGGSTVSSRTASRPQSLTKNNTFLAIAGLSGAALLLIVVLIVANLGGGDEEVASKDSKDNDPAKVTDGKKDGSTDKDGSTPTTKDNGTDKGNGGDNGSNTDGVTPALEQTVVANDVLPYASPTSGPPLSLSYVPQSVGIYMAVRPASMISSVEGSRVLRALGPAFKEVRRSWEGQSGFRLEQIDQLLIGFHENAGKMPRPSFLVRLLEPVSESDLTSRWQNPTSVPIAETNTNYFKGGGWSFYIPRDQPTENGVTLFLMGADPDVASIARGEQVPPLPATEKFLEWTDADRHFSVVFEPRALNDQGGLAMFSGEREKLREPLGWFLGDDLQAGLVSMHFHEAFFAEMRLKSHVDLDAGSYSEAMKERLRDLPKRIRKYITTLGANPYWEELRFQYPLMVSEICRRSRVGVEGEQVLVNCYLPLSAAHNLVAGGELLVATDPGAVVAGPVGQPSKPVPQSLEELLEAKVDVFDVPSQDMVLVTNDVTAAVEDLYANLPFKFELIILGNNLQLAGITKNQRVNDFRAENVSLADILTGIVMKANPITTVKDPSEMDQKLIWVVGPHPSGSGKAVLITTRDGATKKNYTLPKPFQPKAG